MNVSDWLKLPNVSNTESRSFDKQKGKTKGGFTNVAATGIRTLTARVTVRHAIDWATPLPSANEMYTNQLYR